MASPRGGMGGSGPPTSVQTSPEICANPLRSILYIGGGGGGPMHVYCNFLLLTSKEKLFGPPHFFLGWRRHWKYRIVYTTEQKLALEEAFKLNTLITLEHREWLSKRIQLSERQIKIWFQNRRQKVKRIARKGVSCLSMEYE